MLENKFIVLLFILFCSHYMSLAQPSFIVSSSAAPNGYITNIDLTTLDFTDITKVEFSLQWDPQVIELKNLAFPNSPMNLAITNIDTTAHQSGVLTFSWENAAGLTLTDATILFSLEFRAIGDFPSQSPIDFVESPLPFNINRLNIGNINIGFFATSGVVQISNNCRTLDSLSLVSVYNSTHENGVWTNEWDLNQPMNTWYGVGLNEEGCVNTLDLDGILDPSCISCSGGGNNLAGSLPDSVWNLSKARYISLTGNEQLTQDVLSDKIGLMANLTVLSLASINLNGNLPKEIGNLTQLTHLNLNNNQFRGSIPNEIGKLSSLQELDLSNNLFSFCPALMNLPNLQNLILSNNFLTFDDLIPNKEKAAQSYIYSPQKLLNLRVNNSSCGTTKLFDSQDVTFQFPYDTMVANNQYQWKKNNIIQGFFTGNNTYNLGIATNAIIGDWTCQVTNTALPDLTLTTKTEKVKVSTATPLTFKSEKIIGNEGDVFCMDVLVEGFEDIIAYQYQHYWDTSELQFIELKDFNLDDLSESDFNTSSFVDEGIIPTFWLDFLLESVSLPDNTIIYKICFQLKESTTEGFQVSFGGSPRNFPSEFLQETDNEIICVNANTNSNFIYDNSCDAAYYENLSGTGANGAYLTDDTIRVTNSITSAATITPSTNILFQAGNTITLLPNFHANAGSTFSAVIDDCIPTHLLVDTTATERADEEQISLVSSKKNEVKVYPNPVRDKLYIEVNKAELGFEVELFDLMGRRLNNWQFLSNVGQIEVNNLEVGVYFLRTDGGLTNKLVIE